MKCGWSSTKASHYDAINDVGTEYATDYVRADTVGQQDSFKVTPENVTTVRLLCSPLKSGAALLPNFGTPA